MPGYGNETYAAAPPPTKEVKTLKERFALPDIPPLTMVQLAIVGMIALYAFSVRKMNKPVVMTAIVAMATLHAYDHIYRVKRGPERSFFPPAKEEYCTACAK